MVLLIGFAIMAVVQGTRADGPDPPIHIHLTWEHNDTAHTIVVTWKTSTANAGDNVLYDIQPGEGVPNNYDYSAVGSYHTYSGAGGYIHDAELTGLSPNTVYYFICGGENGGWSGERSFRTAPDQSTAFRFVAGGDSRSGSGDWPGSRDDVSRMMAKFNPSFVLFTGDFVNVGSDQAEWDNWFAAAHEYWIDNNGLTIPIIPSIGNHEGAGTNYYGQFHLPENELWYSLDWGPDLHIIVLDSETSISGDQRDWLQQDLAAHENYTWKIAIFHRPAYSGGPHGGNGQIVTYWTPLFDNYHVDLAISGHDHDYERTYPIYQDNVQPSPENGTIYIVTGGWGAPLYEGSPGWWTAYGPDPRYHFVVIDIFENKTLHLKAVDRYGNAFDKINASISPSYQDGLPKTTINFTVTVNNVGTENDNYDLSISDNTVPSWGPTLSEYLLEVPAGENRQITLSVTIPEDAVPCTEDKITVIATSRVDNTAKYSASCIAHAIAPKAEFRLKNLYSVGLDMNLYLDNGSKLVVKFYTYTGDNQGESVIENFVPPITILENENVPHPSGLPVEKARLVLTTDDTANEISTIASWTATKSVLASRYLAIKGEYVKPGADKPALATEYLKVKTQYIKAP